MSKFVGLANPVAFEPASGVSETGAAIAREYRVAVQAAAVALTRARPPIGFEIPEPEPDFEDVVIPLKSQGKQTFIFREGKLPAPEWDE